MTLTAIIVELVPSRAISIIALLLALPGGVVALFASLNYNYRELLNLYIGASSFQELRERLVRDSIDRQLSYKTRKGKLSDLQDEYTKLSKFYDHYVTVGDAPTTPVIQIGSEIAAGHIGEEEVKKFYMRMSMELDDFLKHTGNDH